MVMNTNVSTEQSESVTGITGSYWSKHEGPGPKIMAADTVCGNNVKNRAGETLGQIEHIMLDVPTGRIAYAVMACGGFLGIGEKLFALPWSALTLDTSDKCFILDVDKDRLKAAPGFDKDHWPEMADERWARDVHAYYTSRPYWDEAPSRTPPSSLS